ncbi:unnamed protein product [Microthlaspi erraticum]|uniref:Uncharacterized protein n=1 Tax=Microthlaspi erraticum TaxID=1685480 RepID=A0A6D2K0M4_9BRAS|nr:unnamed protein product [Microthlaspi erraticum]
MVKKIYHKKNVHSWRDLDGRAEPLHARPCPLKPPNTPSHLIPSASHPSHLTTLAFHHYHHSTAFTILQVTPNQKRSYSQKSEGCSRRPYRESAPNAQTGWPRNDVPRSAKTDSVRLKSRPKFKPSGRSRIRPGKHCPAVGQATSRQPRTTKRASRETKPRGRATRSAYHGRCIRPSREDVPRPAEKPSAKSIRPTKPADRKHPARPFRLAKDPTVRPTVPTTVRTPRSTRSRF